MLCIKTVVDTRRGALMMAVERPGRCHLISISRSTMAVVHTIDDLSCKAGEFNDKENAIIHSVNNCRRVGEMIITGMGWIKKVEIMLS